MHHVLCGLLHSCALLFLAYHIENVAHFLPVSHLVCQDSVCKAEEEDEARTDEAVD